MDSTTQIKALIVDAEPAARAQIRDLLAHYSEISIVGETSRGEEAISIIEEANPDLVFLDVEILGINGLLVLRNALNERRAPLIILITASDNYGLEAFEAGVADYLLKPFNEVRFQESIELAVKQLSRQKNDNHLQLSALIQNLAGNSAKYLRQITSRSGNRIFLVKTEDVDWIEAERNYVQIHSRGKIFARRESIGSIESQLDPHKFRRIHRSTIVNLDAIRELQSAGGGEYKVILHSGKELALSRSFHVNMSEFLA